ncbi:toll/interleukin-1 receptor domain-containing protein [Kouleothrix sp.]|uniref:toll/interleukin-1 receptor domain-containing protein n=1 Tax=Kouleothrix sp. TaxID=2779161 RepID=UPI003919F0B3
MTNQPYPRAFISYAHEDKQLAINLAEALTKNGIDPWIDVWEINAGDSLVEKVFEEGLKDCAVFVIVLSSASVLSPWVKQELDTAVINRIRKITQVIPVLAEECEIPVALRALRWLNMKEGMNDVIRSIVDVAYKKKSRKPIIQPAPDRVAQMIAAKQGFSQEATNIGVLIARSLDTSATSQQFFEGKAIENDLDLTPEQINDAVDELATRGLVKARQMMGTHPFDFAWVEPTYALYYEFAQFLRDQFDPDADVRQVAACIASRGEADGLTIARDLNLPPLRINFAVGYLGDYGIIKVIRALGTSPYDFAEVQATSATRRFVKNKNE